MEYSLNSNLEINFIQNSLVGKEFKLNPFSALKCKYKKAIQLSCIDNRAYNTNGNSPQIIKL